MDNGGLCQLSLMERRTSGICLEFGWDGGGEGDGESVTMFLDKKSP